MKTVYELEVLLKSLLNEEANKPGFDRLEWLSDHLCEYLERWLGFARVEEIPLEATLKNDSFTCILAAINVIDKETIILQMPECATKARWAEFKNTIEWIKHSPNRDDLELIGNTFKVFGREAFSKDYCIDDRQAIPIKKLKIEGVE
jgi:hypothetical protein